MSGGSFNYLYRQESYDEDDLRAMADWLREHGMSRAADETLTFVPRKADEDLIRLWHAVEWCVSSDWSFSEVADAHVEYAESRDDPR